jgi:hypothetical protein
LVRIVESVIERATPTPSTYVTVTVTIFHPVVPTFVLMALIDVDRENPEKPLTDPSAG